MISQVRIQLVMWNTMVEHLKTRSIYRTFLICFFTSISSTFECSLEDASGFINDQLENSNSDNKLSFKFSFTTASEIEELFASIQSSSEPRISSVRTKIFKASTKNFKTILAHLFNYSILTNAIPDELE